MVVKNDQQLRSLMKPGFRSAIQYVLDKIGDENQLAIMQEIYYAGAGPSDYEQTGEFGRAWDTAIHTTANIGHDAEGQFFYAPSKITTVNGELGQHASVVTGQDSREYLAEIIYEGMAGDIYGQGFWTKKRDAWSVLIKRIGKRNMKQWMKEGLEYAGFNVTRSGGSIQVTNI